jgi:ABC-2 type transport system ATP-binding protein
MLKIEHLSKSYGKKDVLSDINATLLPGNIYGLVGINGAGKTTLFDALYNMIPHGGLVSFDGLIGYLPSSLYFYPYMKALEYVEFCLAARNIKKSRKEIEAAGAVFALDLQEYATAYSAGMKKKLGLIALLLQDNDLYLLDEPFNDLDLGTCLLLKRVLLALKAKGKTVFLSSHILSSLTEISDCIFYLQRGRIGKAYSKEEFPDIERELTEISLSKDIEALLPPTA